MAVSSALLRRAFVRTNRTFAQAKSILLVVLATTGITTMMVSLGGGAREGLNSVESYQGRQKPASPPAEVVVRHNNDPSTSSSASLRCDSDTVVLSGALETRRPWEQGGGPDSGSSGCARFVVRHMEPGCRPPVALASYPGSGNTWVRYLLEAASGIFTGSRYKDLQLQMYGFYGEIRDWRDGTTLVQKTHDASPDHVKVDFGGRGVLLLRDPYSAILSDHNFLYAGHHGRAPKENFKRKDWEQFVTIQMSKWLDMATNWTEHSTPEKVLVLHYEELRRDPVGQIKRALAHLRLPVDTERIDRCVPLHLDGHFRRRDSSSVEEPEALAFTEEMRAHMDRLIDSTSEYLSERGYGPLPHHLYADYYQRSDGDILRSIRDRNAERRRRNMEKSRTSEAPPPVERGHGGRMVLKNYFKWLDSEDKKALETGVDPGEDLKTQLMRQLFDTFRKNSQQKTVTGLSEQAEGLLEKAVEVWPLLSKPFQRDKIEEAVEADGHRGKRLSELHGSYFN